MRHPAVAVLGQQGAGGGGFDPESDISWHSLFWAEGTNFAAQGYTDTDAVTTWPNETSEDDVGFFSGEEPTFDASDPVLNSRPSLSCYDARTETPGTISTAITQPFSVVVIGHTPQSVVAATPIWQVGDGGSRWYAQMQDNPRIVLRAGGGSEMAVTSAGINIDTDAHLQVWVVDDANGSHACYVDGSQVATAPGDTRQPTNELLNINAGETEDFSLALVGIFNGDITADGNWSAFESWVASHYGITIS